MASWGGIRGMLRKIRFSSPPRADVLIFDNAGSEIIRETILRDIPHAVLHTRYELIYCTQGIIFALLSRLITGKIPRNLPGSLSRRIFLLYLLCCIDCIRPRVVLTWVYDSRIFHYI
jgi:hypothetical protein